MKQLVSRAVKNCCLGLSCGFMFGEMIKGGLGLPFDGRWGLLILFLVLLSLFFQREELES